jgi:hypothetical protein
VALPLKSTVIWLEQMDYVRNNIFIVNNSKTRYLTIGGLAFFSIRDDFVYHRRAVDHVSIFTDNPR